MDETGRSADMVARAKYRDPDLGQTKDDQFEHMSALRMPEVEGVASVVGDRYRVRGGY